MQGQRIKKDNETYFNIKDFYIDFNIGHATIQLDDLFNGDKELGEQYVKKCLINLQRSVEQHNWICTFCYYL